MISILQHLIQINLDPNEIMFTGKWAFMVPFILIHFWLYWRALKSFFRIRVETKKK